MASAMEFAKLVQSRKKKEEKELEEWFTENRKRSRERMVMEFDKDFDLAETFVVSAVGVLSVKKPRLERSRDEQRDKSWWANGYRNWNDEAFKKRLRVNRCTFEYILNEIRHNIVKESTRFKPHPTPPETQLAICLYRLAHGCTFNTIGDLFGVAAPTAAVIFNNVCKVLVCKLYDRYVYLPRNIDEWINELESFLEDWEFPCVGAWDGFHVYISTKLKNYFSFKKRYSVSSMGFIGSNKRFLWAAVGAPGSTHDSRLLRSCPLYNEIQQGNIFPNTVLNLRKHGNIPVTTVGDSAFPRHTWLMKPYNENTTDPPKRYFNKRLCSARVVSEHAYGMLKGRWRILYKKTECRLKHIRQIIMACILLHNICIARDDPCKPRWRMDVKRLHLIRKRFNGEVRGEADNVRAKITEWLWDIRKQRQSLE